jgi:tight adherence protein B
MVMLVLFFILVLASVIMIAMALLPKTMTRYEDLQEKKTQETVKRLDLLFIEVEKNKLAAFFTVGPIVFAAIGLLIFRHWLPAFLLAILGFALPHLLIRVFDAQRKRKFNAHLLDSIMVLSSALKAGLSFLQALEVLVEDSQPPVSQEFGWVVNEIKMGIPLEESLQRLYKRMPSEELALIVNACVISRLTGGDLTKIFSRLAQTIRNNSKLKDDIATLTLQGRIQAVVMMVLPFLFAGGVIATNRHHFDIMLRTQIGHNLIIAAVVLQIVGVFLIYKFSQIDI